MLNNATPSRPRIHHRSVDTDATGARPAVLNFDSAGTVRAVDQAMSVLLRKPLAA